MALLIDRMSSAIGDLLLVVSGKKLCALEYVGYEQRMNDFLQTRFAGFALTDVADPCGYTSRMHAYFDGDLNAVGDIDVDPGGTLFQREVWSMLRKIPVGSTTSYGALATKLGKPGASRAVGLANSLNPVAIVIPCHRVIGADGKLTGYAGGLERKSWLLEHEQALPSLW